jgi:hypothetical protein
VSSIIFEWPLSRDGILYAFYYSFPLSDHRPPSIRRGQGSMQRANSSADISTYGCGDGSRKLQILASIVLLVASLVMIGTGDLFLLLTKLGSWFVYF